jgi:hypothetical protein
VELLLRSCITQRRVGKALRKTFSAKSYKATSLMFNDSLGLLRYCENLLVGLKYNPLSLKFQNPNHSRGFITCTGKKDGVGAQALAIMSTMLFAKESGLTYVHTPFKEIAHNAEQDPQWEIQWEEFFGLGKKELDISQCNHLNVVKIQQLSSISLNSPSTIFEVDQCHQYANLFPNKYEKIIPQLREKYLSSKRISSLCSDRDVSICLHVRRGDVDFQGVYAARYTHNSYCVKVLSQVVDIVREQGLNPKISLYSQGEIKDFRELERMGVVLNLNQCPFFTLEELVNADILIMSKSTFSYVSALLSNNIKIYEPFYSKPLNDWLAIDKQATFSKKKFIRQLMVRINRLESTNLCD